MNLYDMKVVRCVKCDKMIGEIDFDAKVVFPQCGPCSNPLPEGDDKLSYTISNLKNQHKKKLIAITR